MKNTFIFMVLAASMLLSNQIFAQIGFGGRVGVNLSNYNFELDEESEDFDTKAGLDIAGIVNIGLSENFSLQPELHFIQKGYKVEESFGGFSSEGKLTLNYLEIPILAKYAFGTETIKAFALAGPSFGFAATGKSEFCFNGECESEDFEFDENDGFNRNEVSLNLGAGIGFNAGPGQLFLDVRYLLGLSNLNDDDSVDGTVKSRGLNIGVGYMIVLGE